MREAVIIDGVRTPIGKFGGRLSSVRPDDLLAHTYRALIDRAGIDPAMLDDVYAGCGNQAGEDNRHVARMAALLAGTEEGREEVDVASHGILGFALAAIEMALAGAIEAEAAWRVASRYAVSQMAS